MEKTAFSYDISRIARCIEEPLVVLPCGDALGAVVALEMGAEAAWLGSLELSTLIGVPDRYVLGSAQVLATILNIQKATRCRLPLIVDVDAGYGGICAVKDLFCGLNLLRVDMAVIENKKMGIDKHNSMSRISDRLEDLISPQEFRARVLAAKETQRGVGLTRVCARFEDIVVGRSVNEAMASIEAIMDAEPDAIFISCKDRNPVRLFELTRLCRLNFPHLPLVTTTGRYESTPSREAFFDAGLSILILSHQGVRSRLKSLRTNFSMLLKGEYAIAECDMPSIDELLELNRKEHFSD